MYRFSVFWILVVIICSKAQLVMKPSGFYLPPKTEGPNAFNSVNPEKNPSDYSFLNLPTSSPDTTTSANIPSFRSFNEISTNICEPSDDVLNITDWNLTSKNSYKVVRFNPSMNQSGLKNSRRKRLARRKICSSEDVPREIKDCRNLEWSTKNTQTVINSYNYDGCEFKNSTYVCNFISEEKWIMECKSEDESFKMFGLKTDGELWILTYKCDRSQNPKSGELSLILKDSSVEVLESVKTELTDYIERNGFEFTRNLNEMLQTCQN